MKTQVRVVRLVTCADLRKIHAWRRGVGRLKSGEAVLYINRSQTMARLIDSARAVHTYYAPDGMEFDIGLLQKHVAALSLELTLSHNDAKRAFADDDRQLQHDTREAA